MSPWFRSQVRGASNWARRILGDMAWGVQTTVVTVRVALRQLWLGLLWVLSFRWLGGLRDWPLAAKAWLREFFHSVMVWTENVRGLPTVLRVTAHRTVALASFVRKHPGLRRFVLGLPALAMLAAVVTCFSLYYQRDQAEFLARYRAEGDQALRAEQWDGARVRFRRLGEETDYPPPTLYALAQSLEGGGQKDRAEELFERLAPKLAQGYAPAHVRKARAILSKGALNLEELTLAKTHLDRAIQAQPDYDEANLLQGHMFLHFKDFENGRRFLLKAVETKPEVSLTLAQIAYYHLRDQDEARRYAEKAIGVFENRVLANPDDVEARAAWVNALTIRGKLYDAVTYVREGLRRKETPRLRELAAEVYAARFDALANERNAGAERLQILNEGLTLVPESGMLLQRLAKVAELPGPEGNAARKASAKWIGESRAAPGMYLAQASEAMMKNDWARARELLETAYNLSPNWPTVANNLAWVLTTGPEPDLTRALKLIDEVLKHSPNDPTFRDTRGQIYVKQKRWNEALNDLEFALPLLTDKKDTHKALAEVFRSMNLPGRAKAHEEKARQLDQ